ncbi:MAG: orotate phosphoribosyltransferase [Endomicrobium sp.]|jgi:orotate phosphoribosyltransferase|nr:orotate phosphoribosyltransferase [Endomicrobium sp.]
MLQEDRFKKLFKQHKALLNGHFQLSSGLHSNTYFQSALILQYPIQAQKLALELTKKIKYSDIKVDVVISPAIGGIIIGYLVGTMLNARSIFTERINGNVSLRRGFKVYDNEKVLIVEDVITTGLSTKEVIKCINKTKARVVAIAAIVDRQIKNMKFDKYNLPIFTLLNLQVKSYTQSSCPMCLKKLAITKPGSREREK